MIQKGWREKKGREKQCKRQEEKLETGKILAHAHAQD